MSSGYPGSKRSGMLDDLLTDAQPNVRVRDARPKERYACRIESDGTWTVFDVFSGSPVDFGFRPTTDMQMADAEDVMRVLNMLHPAFDCGTIH